MRIYLDVSCLNRPFDDMQQERVRLEAEAVRLIVAGIDRGDLTQASSEMAEIEVAAIPESDLRQNVSRLLPPQGQSLRLNRRVFARAAKLQDSGLKLADALHIAAAESGAADAFLTCYDRVLKWSKRYRGLLQIEVLNPIDWIRRHGHS